MKKVLISLLSILLIGSSALMVERPLALYYEYQVEGGKVFFDFSDETQLDNFRLLTQFNPEQKPRIVDERLVFWSLSEQKAVYTSAKFTNVDISVDIGTINHNGKFDAGIYVQLKDVFTNNLDGVSGWCVNLERGAGDATYYLKLHKFNYGYDGCYVELESLKLPMNLVNLRVVVKDGYLFAFVNHEETPRFFYYVGEHTGYVGLRSFYSPNRFDNLTIIGDANAIDLTYLNELVSKANTIDSAVLTSETANNLSVAIQKAQAVNVSTTNQYELDEIVNELELAIKSIVIKHDYNGLLAIIEQAEAFENPNGNVYTKHSWDALQLVLGRCKTLTDNSSENDISYWANRLLLKMQQLTPYGGAQ